MYIRIRSIYVSVRNVWNCWVTRIPFSHSPIPKLLTHLCDSLEINTQANDNLVLLLYLTSTLRVNKTSVVERSTEPSLENHGFTPKTKTHATAAISYTAVSSCRSRKTLRGRHDLHMFNPGQDASSARRPQQQWPSRRHERRRIFAYCKENLRATQSNPSLCIYENLPTTGQIPAVLIADLRRRQDFS